MPEQPSTSHKTATAVAPISRPTHTHRPTHPPTHTHPHTRAQARVCTHAHAHAHAHARTHTPRLVQGIRLRAGDGRGRTQSAVFYIAGGAETAGCAAVLFARRMLHVAGCTSHAARRMLHGRISSSALVKPAAAHRVMFRAACSTSHVYSEAGTACCMHLSGKHWRRICTCRAPRERRTSQVVWQVYLS
jgi:hypothetical protein